MSGLDYTKKQELGNTSGGIDHNGAGERREPFKGIRSAIYALVFLSRTRFEKWLLYMSLVFGGVGLGIAIYLMQTINTPAPIVVSCDMDKVRELLSIQAPVKAVEKTITTPKKPKKK